MALWLRMSRRATWRPKSRSGVTFWSHSVLRCLLHMHANAADAHLETRVSRLLHLSRLQMSDKERKKINEKTRKQQEAAARAKADALRDDDNVFDVSFEQQGAGGDVADSVVSATDIKVGRPQLH